MITEQMVEAERPQFEAWCKECGLNVTKIMEAYDTRLSYASAYVQGRWDAWLARAALSQKAEGEAGAVACLAECVKLLEIFEDTVWDWYVNEQSSKRAAARKVQVDEFNAVLARAKQVLAHPPARDGFSAGQEAMRDVLAERHRQVSVEGWTPTHDDEHKRGEMATAAACYAAPEAVYWGPTFGRAFLEWPWTVHWWKPSDGKHGRPLDRRRDLVKAGALILAEIERLDRALPITKPDR